MMIDLAKILPNPEQPRRDFSHDELVNLAQSIRQHGVINAISVEQVGDMFVLIDGERRLRAAQIAGLTVIPANVRPGNSNSQQRLVMALAANLQRADMNPIDEARAFSRLRGMGLSNTKIARMVGVSMPLVVSRLRLLELDDEIQDLIQFGHLPKDIRVTEALLRIPDHETRVKFAQRVARPGIGVKGIEMASSKLVQAMQHEQPLSDGIPAMQMAAKKGRRQNAGKPAGWDALRQLGKVPKWETVRQCARDTCDNCSLKDMASEAICRDCQAVELIRRMMGVGDGA